MGIELLTGFDGSCPRDDAGVEVIAKDKFKILPSYRRLTGIDEEVPGGGSRMSVRFLNSGDSPVTVELCAEWETEKRVKYHDFGFVKHESDPEWTMLPGIIKETTVDYSIKLKPGRTQFALTPAYNYENCLAFTDRAVKDYGFSCEVIGNSGEGRDIRMLSLLSKNPAAENFFIQARDHAYETAGSYCVEGITGFLVSRNPMSEFLRSKFNFYIVPMTNPDGVHNGLSRLMSTLRRVCLCFSFIRKAVAKWRRKPDRFLEYNHNMAAKAGNFPGYS